MKLITNRTFLFVSPKGTRPKWDDSGEYTIKSMEFFGSSLKSITLKNNYGTCTVDVPLDVAEYPFAYTIEL
jgi:hypothetical protein